MRSPIFTIPSGSTDSFQEHENDNTFEAEDGHEEDLLDFAVSRLNGSILDEALTHVAQRARQGSSSAASTLKPQSAMGVVHRLSMGGEPSMNEEPEDDRQPDEMGSPVTVVVVDAVGEEARLKANVRRYYALMELFETEKGYLNDLRVLVEVRFSFLPHHVFLPCFRPLFHHVFTLVLVLPSSAHLLAHHLHHDHTCCGATSSLSGKRRTSFKSSVREGGGPCNCHARDSRVLLSAHVPEAPRRNRVLKQPSPPLFTLLHFDFVI